MNEELVLFVGSFNPPLNSHFLLAQQLINEYKQIEKVIFVPVNEKYKKAELISNTHRYNMLKLICDKNEKFEVSRIEIDNKEPLYTIETLEKISKIYSNYKITLAIGSDNLKELETWKRPHDLIKNFKIYAFKRDNDNLEEIISNNEILRKNRGNIIKVDNSIVNNFSSTYIRKLIKENKSIRYLTPQEIVDYIEKNKLYN